MTRHTCHTRTRRRRLLLAPAAAAGLLLASAAPALAHIAVYSPSSEAGESGTLVFRVPTESATASTVKLSITMPTTKPFASVASKPLPGWSVTTTERHLAHPVTSEGFTVTKVVGTVTWTAHRGAAIKPGEFQEFELSVAPFPAKGSVELPATQTYSDGTVVHWNQPQPPGADEPEHPTPTLEVADEAAPASGDAPASPSPKPAAVGSDTLGRWLGGAGLLLGAAALAVALTRRRASVAP